METILIIENQPEMRRNLATTLRLERFLPLTAENGRVGVEMTLKENPDLILCDVMMPELDGYGVLQKLRKALGGTGTWSVGLNHLAAYGGFPTSFFQPYQ